MKKALKIIICVLLVLIIGGGAIAYAFYLPHPLNYDIKSIESIGSSIEVVSADKDTVTVRNTEDRDLKVLMFTDLHLDGNNDTSIMTVTNLVENIKREKPDLVILGGDNVTSGLNAKRSKQFAQIFENLGVYWAGVLGNHEGDNGFSISREKMISIFSSYDHCLMLQGPEDIWGNGNYVLNVLNADGSICEGFVFMDTGDEVLEDTKAEYGIPEDESPYDGVKTNQVDWYRQKIFENQKTYDNYNSIVVTHIPLPQLEEAAVNEEEFLYGVKLEGVCASGFDSGLFDAMKTCGSTKAAFCGHDHLNTFGLLYDGIVLSYIQPSGYGSYTTKSKLNYEEKDWLQGCTILTISKDGSYIHESIRNSQIDK